MQDEKEKQMNMDAVDTVDTGEEQMRNEQIRDERNEENGNKSMNFRNENRTAQEKDGFAPLFESNESEQFRTQWLEIQSHFVDDPNVSVKEADDLVAEVIKSITRTFADKRMALESQWKSGDVSTEDLRVAIKRYRSFFDRLLTLES
jgi:hypothetical protein